MPVHYQIYQNLARNGNEVGLFPFKGRSEVLILDLSHVVYFLSPAPLSPPQRLRLGISIKIAVMEKQEARGGRLEEVKDGSLPLPTLPRALFFFLPSFATTQRGLYGGESPHSLSNRGLFSSKLCLRGLRCCSRPSSSKDDQV